MTAAGIFGVRETVSGLPGVVALHGHLDIDPGRIELSGNAT